MSRNLWGDFPVEEDVKTPESVLRDQAQILAEATQGLLDGRLEFSQKGSDFDIRFYIVAPLLNNFRYLVARVVYPATLFPVEVWGADELLAYTCKDMDEFEEAIGRILQSENTRRAYSVLLAQSRNR